MDPNESVEAYYTVNTLGQSILYALRTLGKDAGELTVDDLAPIDQFHIRGRMATRELAGIADIAADSEVLDVGCGLGGSARYLASEFGCHVTGLDVTREYCDVPTMLSSLVGMDGSTRFQHGSALAMPFESDSFDLVWTEHVQMNIEDKRGFYSEIARVLKPGGRLAFHDIFRGPAGAIEFPVPWAGEQSISFLMSEADLRRIAADLDFSILSWGDVTEASSEFFQRRLPAMESRPPPPLDLALVMGADRLAKFRNLGQAVAEGRATVVLGVMQHAA
jgi:ubiquinone/menaquinone biosynthesis C-methylase UbiE